MNAITVAQPPSFSEMERLADAIARSNMFGMKTKEQALVLMAISQAEGRHPALAARDYDVIGGRPAKKSEAMLRDFLESSGKVEWHALTDELADATFAHPAGGSVRISWDMPRAIKAGLGGKDNWKKFPRQMLRSRTISEGVRTVFPMATSGLYVPEEVAEMPHAGPTLDARPEPVAPEKPAPPGSMREVAQQMTPPGDARSTLNASIPLKDKPQTFASWFAALETDLAQAQTTTAVRYIEAREKVQAVIIAADEGKVQAERSAKVRAAIDAANERVFRTPQAAPTDDSGWPSQDEETAVIGAEAS